MNHLVLVTLIRKAERLVVAEHLFVARHEPRDWREGEVEASELGEVWEIA